MKSVQAPKAQLAPLLRPHSGDSAHQLEPRQPLAVLKHSKHCLLLLRAFGSSYE